MKRDFLDDFWWNLKWGIKGLKPYWLHELLFHRGRSKETRADKAWLVEVDVVPGRRLTEEEKEKLLLAVCDCERLKCCLTCRIPASSFIGPGKNKSDFRQASFCLAYAREQYTAEEAVEYAKLDLASSFRRADANLEYGILRMSVMEEEAEEETGRRYVVGEPEGV